MRRQLRNDEEDPGDAMFRLVDRWMEAMAQSMDRMLGLTHA